MVFGHPLLLRFPPHPTHCHELSTPSKAHRRSTFLKKKCDLAQKRCIYGSNSMNSSHKEVVCIAMKLEIRSTKVIVSKYPTITTFVMKTISYKEQTLKAELFVRLTYELNPFTLTYPLYMGPGSNLIMIRAAWKVGPSQFNFAPLYLWILISKHHHHHHHHPT